MNGTSHDERNTNEPTLNDLAAQSDFVALGARLKAGDEIDRRWLDNDDAATLEAYMQPGLWLERVGLVWIATKTDPMDACLAKDEAHRRGPCFCDNCMNTPATQAAEYGGRAVR